MLYKVYVRLVSVVIVHTVDMFFLLVLILITIIFVYVKLKFFTLYGPIPGQAPRFLLGNLLEMGQLHGKYIGEAFQDYQKKYGDTYQVYLGLLHLICICHPDDVQHVFTHRHIYEQGNLHVDQHRLVLNDALICTKGLLNVFKINIECILYPRTSI